jgi:hypothetical protein
MSDDVLEQLARSVVLLDRVAIERGEDRLVERDLQRALETTSGARSAALRLSRWPQVGRVDLMLRTGTALELKWARSGDTLCNCAWDIAKLASALAEGRAREAFIAAGAPSGHWDAGARGTELFSSRTYDGDAIVRDYEGWWRLWCRDVKTRPVELPASIRVEAAGEVNASLAGTPWTIRLAWVEVPTGGWLTHVCPHRWRGERCPVGFRPWDPDGSGGAAVEAR